MSKQQERQPDPWQEAEDQWFEELEQRKPYWYPLFVWLARI